jgi:hypothetical protein
MENFSERLALVGISSIINHNLLLAVALGYLPRPLQQHDIIQPIQPRLIKVAFIDPSGPHSFTKPIRRFRRKLAGTPIGTITIGKAHTPKHPLIGHPTLLSSTT